MAAAGGQDRDGLDEGTSHVLDIDTPWLHQVGRDALSLALIDARNCMLRRFEPFEDFEDFEDFEWAPYRDYSLPWFGTHRVLKGGSRATRGRLKDPKFRNFSMPRRGDIFCGFRSCTL